VLESSLGRRGTMSCKKCASSSQRSFKSEMSIAFREHENVNRAPVYICQDILVCVDCGYIELSLPPAKLEQLKQEALGPDSQRRFGQDGSVDS
jgi:hypothetical protein